VTQIISVFGAILILAAYLGVQLKMLSAGKLLFSLLNLSGSAALTYIAIVEIRLASSCWKGHGRRSACRPVRILRPPDGAGGGI
jgi:hypothetical protein